MYTVFFIYLDVSSTCFGCYLHPSSGTRMPRTAVGCLTVVLVLFNIYTLFTLHAPFLRSNTTCNVVTYLYSSLPFLFIVWLFITLFYL
jgi:hypothetical protein